jgi:hypothetical protein
MRRATLLALKREGKKSVAICYNIIILCRESSHIRIATIPTQRNEVEGSRM